MNNEIAEFHLRFETIHPFQDGNGRIGRFINLKQCIENDINPIMITDDNASECRKRMNESSEELYEFLLECESYKMNE